MTINAPAIVVMAFYLANAQDRGFDWRQLRGTIQNDILKEFHAQNEIVLSARALGAAGRRRDRVLHAATCRSGTRCRSAAITFARPARRRCRNWPSRWPTAFTTSTQCLARGLDVDEFAPRLSFFFNAHNDVFEEVAKYRAARAVWAERLRNHYGATQRKLVEAAVPCPDGRLLAARQAARGEPDSRRLPGPGRGAGRLPVAAHQQHGRNAGPAVGACRHAGPAHAAGAGPRDRRDQHGRSARRQLLRRNAHAADAAGSPQGTSSGSRSWAA